MYQALYRKWRPAIFSDVVGQNHITLTLKNEIANNRIGHAYLFTGTRGTGKTTCAKIFAKAINCTNSINGEPCNECECCISIDNGTIYDVIEIDAASNNGVDNIRELREDAVYAPSKCKKKVYIIDEVHMLSTGAFNALLKTLEEPPEHIVFILATTEVYKIPATILSRCQRFDFKRISVQEIFQRLVFIAKNEGIEAENDALMIISRLADGALRDALSIFEQCAGNGKRITMQAVYDTVGVTDSDYHFKISDAVINGDCKTALSIVDELYKKSKKLDEFLSELMRHYRDIMAVKVSAESVLQEKNGAELKRIKDIASKYTLSGILYCISTINESLYRMLRINDSRTETEVCLIKLCNPKLSTGNEALSVRVAKLESIIKSGVSINKENSKENDNTEESVKQEDIELDKKATTNKEKLKPAPFWADTLQELKQQRKMQICGFLKGSKAVENGEHVIIFVSNSIAFDILNKNENIKLLKDIIENITGKAYKVSIQISEKKAKTQAVLDIDDGGLGLIEIEK